MADKKVLVNYTNRDFNSIKRDLEEHARRYYPESYRDFSENSFGSYVLDTVSYVGDMLSFYLDYQVNESFLETAVEYENVRRHVRNAGYRYTGRPPAFGLVTFYVIVPANTTGIGPNRELIPILKTGSEVKADGGATFVLIEDVNFGDPKNEVVAARFDNNTGKPTHYAIRAKGQVRSTVLYRVSTDVGEFQRFRRIRVGTSAIAEIKSVRDSEGHEYYEVEHLAQDVVFINTTNPNAASDGVPQIIKPKVVPRRFVVIQDDTGTYLQFGYGSDDELTTNDIADPSQVSVKMSGKPFITDYAFDPSQLLDTNTLGVAPANTTITTFFYQNDSDSVNVAAGALSNVVVTSMEFPRDTANRLSLQAQVRSSLECSNEEPIIGNTSVPTSEELRYRTYAAKSAQMRSVTRNDYEAYIYMMPANFGSVKRASVINDPSSTNRRLSVYVVGENGSGSLIPCNSTIKENIKTWLNKNKMLNDNLDIYDAKILNLGFDYEIIVHPSRDKAEVLNSVQQALRTEMSDKMYIGEPFYLTNVFNIINKVDGVIDTTKVVPVLKTGTGYSSAPVGIDDMKSHDGTYLKAPRNVIFEIKNFNTDVRGSAA
jgi:phage-related baseplate assembly protein